MTLTIGVAIGLPEPHASRLQEARRRFGDPMADLIKTHVTLLGPTRLPGDALPAVAAHLEEVAAGAAPFSILLDGTDTFRPVSPVVFLRVAEGGASCAALADAVRTGPLAVPQEFPYHPHVTLAHEVPDGELDTAAAEMAWYRLAIPVREFQLYRLGDDGRWSAVRSFTLGGR